LRMLVHVVGPPQIFQKQFARPLETGGSPETANFFALAVIASQAQHVALIGEDINQFVIAEKSAYRRILLADFLAASDRNCDVIVIAEAKAQDRVQDPWRSPIGNEHVDATQLR